MLTFALMDRGVWKVSLCYIKQLLCDAKIHENGMFFSLFGTGFLVLWTGVRVYPTVRQRFYCYTMSCISSQYIIWKTKLGKRQQHIYQLDRNLHTSRKGLEPIKTYGNFWIHPRSGRTELNGETRRCKINSDVDPRGLHSFIKTCHSLTFTPCWNNWLLGSRSET